MKKRLLAILAILALPSLAMAQASASLDQCKDVDTTAAPSISAGVLTATQTFTFTQANDTTPRGFYKSLEVFMTLTDANSSISRLDWTCTGSRNSNSTDATPLDCTSVLAGVSTCVPSGIFRTAVAGSGVYHFAIDISRVPDVECALTVGAGAATASVDTISAWVRACNQ